MSLTLSRDRHRLLTDCLAAQAVPLAKSKRFTVYDLDPPPRTDGGPNGIVVVHDFARSEIDNNVAGVVAYELMPLLASLPPAGAQNGYALSEQEIFERFVGAIVRSVDDNEQRAWHLFYDNTLRALDRARRRLRTTERGDTPPVDFIATFAAIYERAIDLMADVAPRTWLDVATCFGFLPFHVVNRSRTDSLVDRQLPRQIFACDVNAALISLAQGYASHRRLSAVRFFRRDMLASDTTSEPTPAPARFDVVTAIHVLEHLEPEQTAPAMAALWSRTARRLMVAVPIERIADPRYGHRQVFDLSRVQALGDDLVDGSARAFEDRGAWLVVDRVSQQDNGRERMQ